MPNQPKLLRALGGEAVSPPPIWLMRQAGRYLPEYRELRGKAPSFLEFCYTPALAVEATLQPIHRFGLDAAILFSDILVVPDGLGQAVRFVEGEGPKLDPVTPGSLAKLTPAKVTDHLAPVYEAVARIKQALPGDVPLLGFAGAPWTVATYMVEGGSSRDYHATRRWGIDEPDSFARLMEIITQATVDHLLAQVAAGVDAVQLFDSWAGILPVEEFARYSIAPAREITARLKAVKPDLPVIGFPRGAGVNYEAFARETGVDAISIDSTVPPEWARRALTPHCAVQGNLDSLVLAAGGPRLEEETAGILAAFAGVPFVFNLGHGILPVTPPEHVAALVEMVRAGVR